MTHVCCQTWPSTSSWATVGVKMALNPAAVPEPATMTLAVMMRKRTLVVHREPKPGQAVQAVQGETQGILESVEGMLLLTPPRLHTTASLEHPRVRAFS